MEPFKQRLIDEHSELAARLGKLSVFIADEKFSGLTKTERNYLLAQKQFMDGYLDILEHRLAYYAITTETKSEVPCR